MLITPIFSLAPISNAREGPSLCSSLKRLQIYESENSAVFFYSEIEHCWLVFAINGVIAVNGFALKDQTAIIEESAKVTIGSKTFTFTNLTERCSLSKLISNALFKRKKLCMKAERILKIIQSSVTGYKDAFFIFDVLRHNPIFKYRYGELSLNAEVLYDDLMRDRTSFTAPLKFEYENTVRNKEKLYSVNVATITSNTQFYTMNKEGMLKPPRFAWPRKEMLEAHLSMIPDNGSSSTVSVLPMTRQNARYINSYIIQVQKDILESYEERRSCKEHSESFSADSTEESNSKIKDISESQEESNEVLNNFYSMDSGEMQERMEALERDYSESKEINSTTNESGISKETQKQTSIHFQIPPFGTSIPLNTKRKMPYNEAKRYKFDCNLDFKPVIQTLHIPGDSETSSVISFYSDAELEKRPPTERRKYGSHVEYQILQRKGRTRTYIPLESLTKAHKESTSQNRE